MCSIADTAQIHLYAKAEFCVLKHHSAISAYTSVLSGQGIQCMSYICFDIASGMVNWGQYFAFLVH